MVWEHTYADDSEDIFGRFFSNNGTLVGESFGSFDRWEVEYRRVAAGLGGGSGWVVLGYNRHLECLENYWVADHMHCPVDTTPLLVLDMYEHSYHMDFGTAAKRYVDAFFANINWETQTTSAKSWLLC